MPATLKRLIKRLIQHYYCFIGTSGISNTHPSLIVLMYHRILPKSDSRYCLEQPGMIVEPNTFKLHLELLREHFTITSINKWINTPLDERPNGISCAISFDDGWADNYTYAYPLLKNSRCHATIFLVTDLIGTNKQFWPEQLTRLLNIESKNRDLRLYTKKEWKWLFDMAPGINLEQVDLNPDQFDIIINNLKLLGEAEIYNRLDAMEATLPADEAQHTDILNWEQIIEMQNEGLVDFGSHTRNHIRMNKIDSPLDLQHEIAESKNIIEDKLGNPIDIFCYPNGDITQESENMVKKHYQCATTTMPGINLTSTDPYRIKRIGMHQDESFDKIAFLSRIYKLMRR